MKRFLPLSLLMLSACASTPMVPTAEKVDLQRFMTKWYVLAGRFTPFEKEPHNAVESYTWNAEKKQIDIAFDYRQGSLTGEKRAIPQTGWVENAFTGAHWKVSPWWPLKFDYLILAVADDYSWTAIGVPSQKYLWIMAQDWRNPEATIEKAVKVLKAQNYNVDNMVRVPQQWP